MRSLFHRLTLIAIIAPIKLYQLCISPFIGNRCRFHPSCSTYTLEAVAEHGAIKGSILSIKRISRCHPWSDGGYDPVPDTVDKPSKNDQ